MNKNITSKNSGKRNVAFSFFMALLLVFMLLPDCGLAQSKSASSKQKKVPKTTNHKAKVTKKSKPGKVKKVSPKSASGRGKGQNKTVRPGFTKNRGVPKFRKVVPKSATGRTGWGSYRSGTNSGSKSSGYNYKNKVVRPNSASSGYGYKNKAVTPRSGSTGFKYKGGAVRGRSASSGFNYKGGDVRGRSASTGFKYRGGDVRGRSASSGFNYKGGKTSPRSASSGFNFKGGSPNPRSATRGYGYKSGLVRPRTATGLLKFKDKGVSPRYSQRRGGPDQTKVQIRTQKGKKKYFTTNVQPRSIKSNPKLHVGGAKKRYLSKPPSNNGAIFAGGMRIRGRGPKLIEQKGGRAPARGNKKYRVVKVEPRSIKSNPSFKRSSNQTKLITYPKDLSSLYAGNTKVKRGHKRHSAGTKNLNYSGDIKQRNPKHRDVGTYYSGDLKHKGPEHKDLGKRTYEKSKSQAQWASYYRNKTRKQSNFIGFQKNKLGKDKWMHPSVNHKMGKFVGSYKQKEKIRKTNLWISRKLKNDDQPKYLKKKEKKPGYDKDEIKIWNDYDNSRGAAESTKEPKFKKKKNKSDDGN